MPTEREIYEGAKALALRKCHASKLREDMIASWMPAAKAVLVAAEAARISAAELNSKTEDALIGVKVRL